ncbi:MAG: enoyl-CoA hydratase/isomerase family protein [Deltaproteobacteria bacterium]|nr:enoyl-CoA hydratase/isomerase family protein [Deltaproteobacteria bacterium]
MTPAFFERLAEVFGELNRDPELRAVVLRSSAKAFSYGLDLPAAFSAYGELFAGGGASQRTQLLALIERLQSSIHAVASCPVPVIAAPHGHCIGGGIDLITACDFRLCSADANFSVRETRIAIVADLGTLQRLPLIIGRGPARELVFTGRDFGASEAVELGFCNRSYADRDALWAEADALARAIADNPPLTVRGCKRVMDFGERHGAQAGFDYVAAWNSAFLASEDLGEAMAAFMQKRAPSYKGK